MTLLNEQIRKANLTKGIYYYFLPTYRQAKQVIWDSLVKNHVPMELVDKLNESELAIYWKNGSIQRFAGCEDFDKHRGINPIDVVFDEFPEMDERIWTVIIQPILRENRGTASFGYTPKGQNHAFRLLQAAKDNDQWFWDIRSVYDTMAIEPAELEEAKANTPEAYFKQEYLCEFLDSAGSFFRRIHENLWEGDLTPEYTRIYQLGVDLAKYQDWTVITPVDLTTFRVGRQERFNQVDWNLQKSRIEAASLRHNGAKTVIDSTGVGDPIVEDLERMGVPIEPYRFTATSKRQLLDNLAILLEQDRIKLPNDPELIAELQGINFALDERGRVKLETAQGMTDDRVMSLALAVWGLDEPVHPSTHEFGLYSQQFD